MGANISKLVSFENVNLFLKLNVFFFVLFFLPRRHCYTKTHKASDRTTCGGEADRDIVFIKSEMANSTRNAPVQDAKK